MSGLFLSGREVNFINSITKELIQKVIEQKVIYYSISEEHTKTHRLYDEAIKKTSWRPVKVNALVLYDEPLQTTSQFSIDTVYTIEVYFQRTELDERCLKPREGDFLKFGKIVYEIQKLTRSQILYGLVESEVMLKAQCRVARTSQFEVLDEIPGS